MSSNSKPFKIWNWRRSVKKSCTASSLKELIEKGTQKLSLEDEDEVHVVLEEDGTEVDDEEYFTFLPPNTVFLLLGVNESWYPQTASVCMDETDNMAADETSQRSLIDLITAVNKDITQIITFSSDELQSLVDANTEHIAAHLQDRKLALSVQTSCQRYLDERREAAEAIQLLKLYHNAQQNTSTSNKRQRTQ